MEWFDTNVFGINGPMKALFLFPLPFGIETEQVRGKQYAATNCRYIGMLDPPKKMGHVYQSCQEPQYRYRNLKTLIHGAFKVNSTDDPFVE